MEEGFSWAFSLLVGPGSNAPNVLIAMDFGNKNFVIPVECVQETRVAAIAAVHAHHIETDTELALVENALKGDLRFGGKAAVILGDTCIFAALGVIAPALWQVEANIAEGRLLAAGKAGADCDLAVFNFTQATDVLAFDADGGIALFLDAAVIDNEATTCAAAKQPIGPAGDLVHQRAVIPRRMTDGVVNALIIEIRHMLLHTFEVFGSAFGLHETEEIGLDFDRVVVAASSEKADEVFHEREKARCGSNNML